MNEVIAWVVFVGAWISTAKGSGDQGWNRAFRQATFAHAPLLGWQLVEHLGLDPGEVVRELVLVGA